MITTFSVRVPRQIAMTGLLISVLGLASAEEVKVKLAGDQEVPAVASAATGTGTIVINEDKSVAGTLTTAGIAGTMAHIHLAGPGMNGPAIISLVKTADNAWSVPTGAKLTDEQFQSFKNGDLYVNVHSDAHKGGEIRAQLKP
jgi:CHRD domain